jgi:site-specific recombinase XerD
MESMYERLRTDMELKDYSPHTRVCYLARVREFLGHFDRPVEEIGKEDIRAYLHHLIKEKRASQSVVAQTYSALRFFYEITLERDWSAFRIPRVKTPKRLPVVLAKEEVADILAATENLKYRAILATIYSGGLRVSEAAHLKVSDIDSDQMTIYIGHGKRSRNRYTILARYTLELLREYWSAYRPADWLFPGKPPSKPVASRSIQYAFTKAFDRAGIKKPATIHSLRHSFATHLVDAGTNLCHIQQLLGHASPRTTSIYLHISRRDIGRIISPLDLLAESAG